MLVVGFPLAVVYKFFEDQGPYLAALITFYGFLSLFPLLLLLASLLGFVLESRLGQRHAQGWEFYAAALCLFVTFAFPGFVWRYLRRYHG